MLKTKKRQRQSNHFAPEANESKGYFVLIGSVVAAQTEPQKKNRIRLNRVEKTMFVSPTNAQEVTKVTKHLKNKKSNVPDGISNECCSTIVEPILAKKILVRTFKRLHIQPGCS